MTDTEEEEEERPPDISTEQVHTLRHQSQTRLKLAWDAIYEKYGKVFEDTDEIDLESGEIVVDNGFIRGSETKGFGESLMQRRMLRKNKRKYRRKAEQVSEDEEEETSDIDPLCCWLLGSTSGFDIGGFVYLNELDYDDDAFESILEKKEEDSLTEDDESMGIGERDYDVRTPAPDTSCALIDTQTDLDPLTTPSKPVRLTFSSPVYKQGRRNDWSLRHVRDRASRVSKKFTPVLHPYYPRTIEHLSSPLASRINAY